MNVYQVKIQEFNSLIEFLNCNLLHVHAIPAWLEQKNHTIMSNDQPRTSLRSYLMTCIRYDLITPAGGKSATCDEL